MGCHRKGCHRRRHPTVTFSDSHLFVAGSTPLIILSFPISPSLPFSQCICRCCCRCWKRFLSLLFPPFLHHFSLRKTPRSQADLFSFILQKNPSSALNMLRITSFAVIAVCLFGQALAMPMPMPMVVSWTFPLQPNSGLKTPSACPPGQRTCALRAY